MDDAKQYKKFIKGFCGVVPAIRVRGFGKYYETESGVWHSTILRYEDSVEKKATTLSNPKVKFFLRKNCTVKATAKMLAHFKQDMVDRKMTKPICVVTGNRGWGMDSGHAFLIVLQFDKDGNWTECYIKDGKNIKESKVKRLATLLAESHGPSASENAINTLLTSWRASIFGTGVSSSLPVDILWTASTGLS